MYEMKLKSKFEILQCNKVKIEDDNNKITEPVMVITKETVELTIEKIQNSINLS